MKTITINNSAETINPPLHHKDGCSHKSADETLKMRLRSGMGLTDDQFAKTALEIINNRKESFSNKIFAVQNLTRVQSAEAEDNLIRIVVEKDSRLSFAALKTLAFTGTAKTVEALSKIKSLPYKSLERQKDFTLLLIGYRYGLQGTDQILSRLLADTPARAREEFPLRFRIMETDDIEAVLNPSASAHYGITLSRKTAFEVKVAAQTFYFCFTKPFEEPAAWQEALQTKQVLGLLLKKELHTTYITNQYVALVTPARDHAQISIFRKNGELFMLASVIYNHENMSFTVTNPADEIAGNKEHKGFTIDQKAFVNMNLSYLRRNKKRKAEIII